MSNLVKTKYFRNEAQDRVNIKVQEIENSLLDHPYYLSQVNPKFNKALDKAIKSLCKAYQLVDKDFEQVKKINLDETISY